MRLSSVIVAALARSSVVGTLWSGTAMVFSGARTLRPVIRRPFKGLGAGHLVHEVAVDIQQAGAVIGLVDNMVVPDLVVKRTQSGHGSHLSFGMASGNKAASGNGGASPAGKN